MYVLEYEQAVMECLVASLCRVLRGAVVSTTSDVGFSLQEKPQANQASLPLFAQY